MRNEYVHAPIPHELKNPQVEPILRKYLELRYRLLPVHLHGRAGMLRHRAADHARALAALPRRSGRGRAAATNICGAATCSSRPSSKKGPTTRRLYLPRGTWFDFWTEERLDGGREIERPVDLETMPLHVRAGAILPLGPVRQYVDEPVDGPLTLVDLSRRRRRASLYEDDGRTFDYRKGDWMRIEMGWAIENAGSSLGLARGSRMRPPAKRARGPASRVERATRPSSSTGARWRSVSERGRLAVMTRGNMRGAASGTGPIVTRAPGFRELTPA